MADRGVGLLCPLIKQHIGRLGGGYHKEGWHDTPPPTHFPDSDKIYNDSAKEATSSSGEAPLRNEPPIHDNSTPKTELSDNSGSHSLFDIQADKSGENAAKRDAAAASTLQVGEGPAQAVTLVEKMEVVSELVKSGGSDEATSAVTVAISSDLPAFTTTLKEEYVEGGATSASSTTENTPRTSPQRTAAFAPSSTSRPQIIIEDGSFLSSQFSSSHHQPSLHPSSSTLVSPRYEMQADTGDDGGQYAMSSDDAAGLNPARSGRAAGRVRKREGGGGDPKEESAGTSPRDVHQRRDAKRTRTGGPAGSSRHPAGHARRASIESSNDTEDESECYLPPPMRGID
jgi:hypothetical protein